MTVDESLSVPKDCRGGREIDGAIVDGVGQFIEVEHLVVLSPRRNEKVQIEVVNDYPVGAGGLDMDKVDVPAALERIFEEHRLGDLHSLVQEEKATLDDGPARHLEVIEYSHVERNDVAVVADTGTPLSTAMMHKDRLDAHRWSIAHQTR